MMLLGEGDAGFLQLIVEGRSGQVGDITGPARVPLRLLQQVFQILTFGLADKVFESR